jgi:hypothetical protein
LYFETEQDEKYKATQKDILKCLMYPEFFQAAYLSKLSPDQTKIKLILTHMTLSPAYT